MMNVGIVNDGENIAGRLSWQWLMAGKEHTHSPKWMELESAFHRSIRGKGWWNFRKMIFDKRGYKCQKCGDTGSGGRRFKGLHVHHIKDQKKHKHLKFEPSNVVILCQECHNREHNDKFVTEFYYKKNSLVNDTRQRDQVAGVLPVDAHPT